jgi:hypothetical protein
MKISTAYTSATVLSADELRTEIAGLRAVEATQVLSGHERTYLESLEKELHDRTALRITGAEARELIGFVVTYVKPVNRTFAAWFEVQVMRECAHGCKLYVRENSAGELVFQLAHSALYGCALGRGDKYTRTVPVIVDLEA